LFGWGSDVCSSDFFFFFFFSVLNKVSIQESFIIFIVHIIESMRYMLGKFDPSDVWQWVGINFHT